jgi:hypothetical protein
MAGAVCCAMEGSSHLGNLKLSNPIRVDPCKSAAAFFFVTSRNCSIS